MRADVTYPDNFRMVHIVEDSTMEGRRFFYFTSPMAVEASLAAYRTSHLERGWIEDLYGEHRTDDGEWVRLDAKTEQHSTEENR